MGELSEAHCLIRMGESLGELHRSGVVFYRFFAQAETHHSWY